YLSARLRGTNASPEARLAGAHAAIRFGLLRAKQHFERFERSADLLARNPAHQVSQPMARVLRREHPQIGDIHVIGGRSVGEYLDARPALAALAAIEVSSIDAYPSGDVLGAQGAILAKLAKAPAEGLHHRHVAAR